MAKARRERKIEREDKIQKYLDMAFPPFRAGVNLEKIRAKLVADAPSADKAAIFVAIERMTRVYGAVRKV